MSTRAERHYPFYPLRPPSEIQEGKLPFEDNTSEQQIADALHKAVEGSSGNRVDVCAFYVAHALKAGRKAMSNLHTVDEYVYAPAAYEVFVNAFIADLKKGGHR